MFGLSVLIQRERVPPASVLLLCWLLAAFPVAAETTVSSATSQVVVNLRLPRPDSAVAPLRLEVESEVPGKAGEKQVYELARPSRETVFYRPPARLQVASEAYWAPEVALTPDLSEVDLELWPVALVSGGFAEGSAPGPRVKLGFQPVRLDPNEKSREQPRGKVECDPGRTFTCRLPAGALDLKLEVEGYMPLYFWNRQLKPGSKLDLGKLKLEKGASVAGWVDLPAGIEPGNIEVVLEIATTGFLGDPVLGTQLKRKRREGKVDPSGFFQIGGVEPGPFTLFARTPGRPDGPKEQVQIHRDEESVLGTPLELPEPGRLRVWISPGADPWQFTLLARQTRSQLSQEVKAETPGDSGWLELGDLPVGNFHYQITDGNEGIWKSGELEIVAGENPPLLIEIPQVKVAGKVLLGNEPVAAKILFGGMREQQIPIDSREDGTFQGFLPRDGRWEIAAELPEAGYVRLESVEARENQGAENVRLDLLETSRIRGRALIQGIALAGAQITAVPNPSQLGQSIAVSGIDGTFEVALPAEATDAVLIGLAQGYAAAIEPVRIRGPAVSLNLSVPAGDLLVRGIVCRPGSHTLVYGSVRIDLFEVFVALLAAGQAIEGPDTLALQGLPVGNFLLCDNRAGKCLEAVIPVGGQASIEFES